jgi:Cu-Zn family superoxide dismutase
MVPAAAPTGDLPNQFVQTDGMLWAHVRNPQVTLGAGKATLFDVDGSALVIHTQADDSTSQPVDEAGDRLAGTGILPR